MAPAKNMKHCLSFQKKEENELKVNELNGKSNGRHELSSDIKIIAQEIQIVKSLACNDLTRRNKQIKKLRKWLQIRTKSSFTFTLEDFMRIWKGLYYNMWYSDKPLVQEELAEQLCKLLECFDNNLRYCMDFFKAFLKTMCVEWFGIDQWRIDKFLMLTRRMLRYMFKLLKSFNWSVEAIELFNKHATETVLSENVSAKGLTMHYFDIFLEELAKVSEGNISSEQVGMFVKPFIKFIATQRDFNLISHCRNRIFYHLLYQSALGREYSEKYNAWKDMGFPTKNINDLEKIEGDENEDVEEITEECGDSKHLDPRAGNIDVFMPELPVDAQFIVKETENFLYKEEFSTKRRKVLRRLLDLFKTFQNGEFPLGIKTIPRFEVKSEKPLIKEKLLELDNLENELYGVDRKLKQMTKRKRRKFLMSLNFDEVDENNYEQTLEKSLPKDYLNERRKRSRKFLHSGWLEEELREEDLHPKRAKCENLENGKSVQRKQTNNLQKPVKKCKEPKEIISETQNKTHFKINDDRNLLDNNINKYENKISHKDINKNDNQEQFKTKQSMVLKISDSDEESALKSKNKVRDEWNEPLEEGEVEYFIPSRKRRLNKANSDLVLNPLAKQRLLDVSTPAKNNITCFSEGNTPNTSGSKKRVKIALKHNTSQNPIEYIQQIRSSPNIPYDATKKPGKGLLKPNAMPSPINPFYRNQIGLKMLNDTI